MIAWRKSVVLLIIVVLLVVIGAKLVGGKASAEVMPITHCFTHSLISNDAVAFSMDNPINKYLEEDCLTTKEFKTIIERLYANDYMLVDIDDTYHMDNGKIYKQVPNLPKGKKPLVMSFDDINYYAKKLNMGMSTKLILANGRLATYTDNAVEKISYDNETITILETFVAEHPDFSYRNAKGVICLTGFDGILGYRTQFSNPNRAQEVRKVMPIVEYLKDNNWKFASHSFGHYHMKKQSYNEFTNDIARWKTEVEPLIGHTNLYCYPYGEWEISTDKQVSMKHEYLLQRGFNYYFSVGSAYYFHEKQGNSCLFTDRVPLDGNTLIKRPKSYRDLFSVEGLLDNKRLKQTR